MSEVSFPEYQTTVAALKASSIVMTPAELHGLLTGMLSGGLALNDKSWQPILFDYSNEGMGWPTAALTLAESIFKVTATELSGASMKLSMLLPEELGDDAVFTLADCVSDWVNHFISGLGLAGAAVNKASGDVKEALGDLEEIARLGIDEDDDIAEQAQLLEQVIEHMKACVLTIHAEYGARPSQDAAQIAAPTVH